MVRLAGDRAGGKSVLRVVLHAGPLDRQNRCDSAREAGAASQAHEAVAAEGKRQGLVGRSLAIQAFNAGAASRVGEALAVEGGSMGICSRCGAIITLCLSGQITNWFQIAAISVAVGQPMRWNCRCGGSFEFKAAADGGVSPLQGSVGG